MHVSGSPFAASSCTVPCRARRVPTTSMPVSTSCSGASSRRSCIVNASSGRSEALQWRRGLQQQQPAMHAALWAGHVCLQADFVFIGHADDHKSTGLRAPVHMVSHSVSAVVTVQQHAAVGVGSSHAVRRLRKDLHQVANGLISVGTLSVSSQRTDCCRLARYPAISSVARGLSRS